MLNLRLIRLENIKMNLNIWNCDIITSKVWMYHSWRRIRKEMLYGINIFGTVRKRKYIEIFKHWNNYWNIKYIGVDIGLIKKSWERWIEDNINVLIKYEILKNFLKVVKYENK
jgi:hypothetical protein